MGITITEDHYFQNRGGRIVKVERIEPDGEIAFVNDGAAGYHVFVDTGTVWGDEDKHTVWDLVLDLGAEFQSAPVRVQILQEGARLTSGKRDREYGVPAVNMAAAAALKAAFRQHLQRSIDPAELEAIDLALTKLGRVATGKPKRDTYVDAATYLAIAGEIALQEPDADAA